jgi:type IV pilus assembly protein PilE
MVGRALEVTSHRVQNPHPMKPKPIARRAHSGFTLIEVLIAVIIVGVLLTVALPSFMDSVRKGRRSEAFAAMAALQQAQERWRSSNATYASSSDPGFATATTSPGGYYSVSVAAGSNATDYEIIADGTGSSQANDGACSRLGVRVEGAANSGAIRYASGSSFSYAASNPCWSR